MVSLDQMNLPIEAFGDRLDVWDVRLFSESEIAQMKNLVRLFYPRIPQVDNRVVLFPDARKRAVVIAKNVAVPEMGVRCKEGVHLGVEFYRVSKVNRRMTRSTSSGFTPVIAPEFSHLVSTRGPSFFPCAVAILAACCLPSRSAF